MKATKISKKEVKAKVQTSLLDVALALNVQSPSKKTLKVIEKAALSLAESLKNDHRKQSKKKTDDQPKAEKPKQKKIKAVIAV
jgi:hypothetical protein